MDAIDIAREQLRAFEAGKPFATVTIVDAKGTTSRTYSKMLVFADGTAVGTVGGSDKEKAAIADAVACIRTGKPVLRTYGDGIPSADGKCCGGAFTMFIEPSPARPRLVVVGGGHVGGAVLRLGKFLGYDTWLVDDRDEEFLADKLPLASRFIPIKDYEADLRALDIPPDSFVVLCSYSHATDGAALAAMLEKDCAYLGMLGSRKKIARLLAGLEARGYDPRSFRRVRTPIGLDLGGETPEEVALSIISEIQAVRYGRPGTAIVG